MNWTPPHFITTLIPSPHHHHHHHHHRHHHHFACVPFRPTTDELDPAPLHCSARKERDRDGERERERDSSAKWPSPAIRRHQLVMMIPQTLGHVSKIAQWQEAIICAQLLIRTADLIGWRVHSGHSPMSICRDLAPLARRVMDTIIRVQFGFNYRPISRVPIGLLTNEWSRIRRNQLLPSPRLIAPLAKRCHTMGKRVITPNVPSDYRPAR